DGIIADCLQPHDADMAPSRDELLLAGAVPLHLGGGAFHTQKLRRETETFAIGKADGESFFCLFQADFRDFGSARKVIGLAGHFPPASSSSRASSTSMIGMPLRMG